MMNLEELKFFDILPQALEIAGKIDTPAAGKLSDLIMNRWRNLKNLDGFHVIR